MADLNVNRVKTPIEDRKYIRKYLKENLDVRHWSYLGSNKYIFWFKSSEDPRSHTVLSSDDLKNGVSGR